MMPLQDVYLHIFKGHSLPEEGGGWEPTSSSDGLETYWYKYTGGNTSSDNGNNESKIPANSQSAQRESFEVRFAGQPGQNFEFTEFTSSPGDNQITGDVTSTLVTVTDENTKEGKYYWAVKVKEKGAPIEKAFYCDPGIINRK